MDNGSNIAEIAKRLIDAEEEFDRCRDEQLRSFEQYRQLAKDTDTAHSRYIDAKIECKKLGDVIQNLKNDLRAAVIGDEQ